MIRIIRAGPVSTRAAYRWLRSLPRLGKRGDVHFMVFWGIETLPDAVRDAVEHLDRMCKTLDGSTDDMLIAVRTRCWGGRAETPERKLRNRREAHQARTGCPRRVRRQLIRATDQDRKTGMEYARRLSALLRAAHAARFDLFVQEDR